MSADNLRAAIERLADEMHARGCHYRHQQGETDECNSCTAHRFETLLAEHPAPEPPSEGGVTAEELAEVVRLARMVAYEDGMDHPARPHDALARPRPQRRLSDEIAVAILARYDVRKRP